MNVHNILTKDECKDFAFVSKFKVKTSLGYYCFGDERRFPKDNCESHMGELLSFL